ncbi:MFS transporter [Streptomyces sp. SID8379]|uniref:MFS transporter n=1 Tax=unclassified Streptomyces TaxID=2593676 RepID=UPI00039E8275|nr:MULTISPECIES: MFS transporter [unclassified Streptomyces]MYW64060.1 MFS transporter [Streptomyces sp. SID8379]
MSISGTTAVPVPPVEAGGRKRLTLGAVLLAVFVVPMSISGTAVELPGIGADLHASDAALQWVVNAFNVAFACCTLVWGSVADIMGRVRVFAAGAFLFALAAAGSAFASDPLALDAARALAGVGGAAIFSAGAAILSTAYEGAERARAFALFGAVAGIGVSLGPTFAGQLVAGVGWRWVFALHAAALLVALCAVPVIARTVPDSVRGSARLDVPGGLVFVAATVLLTTGIVQASQWGWMSAGTVALFAAALVALAVFVVVERRSAHPVLDLGLLRERRFLGLALVPVAASFGFVTLLTYLPSYLTAVTGRDSSAAGRLMLLLTLPVPAFPVLAARLVERGVGARKLILVSLGCLVVGDLGLLLFSPHAAVAVIALPMIVTGAGMGLSAGLVDGQALALVAPEKAGMAAGFVNTLRLGSEAVAVAVYGSVMASLVGAGHAYDSAFHGLLWGLAAACLVLGLVVAWLLRGGAATRS